MEHAERGGRIAGSTHRCGGRLQCSHWAGMGNGPQGFGSIVSDGKLQHVRTEIKLTLVKSVWAGACGRQPWDAWGLGSYTYHRGLQGLESSRQ